MQPGIGGAEALVSPQWAYGDLQYLTFFTLVVDTDGLVTQG